MGWAYELLQSGWFSMFMATLVDLTSASTNNLTYIGSEFSVSSCPVMRRSFQTIVFYKIVAQNYKLESYKKVKSQIGSTKFDLT